MPPQNPLSLGFSGWDPSVRTATGTPALRSRSLRGFGDMPTLPPSPRQNMPPSFRPALPPIDMDELFPAGSREVTGAYSDEPVRGTALYGGQRLNTPGALEGLRAAGEEQPWMARSRAIQNIGSTGRPQDLALARQFGADYESDYADPIIEKTRAAEQALHPATQAVEEATARRGAYPAETMGEYQVDAANINAAARQIEAQYGLSAEEAKALVELAKTAMTGLTDIQTIAPSSTFPKERIGELSEQQQLLLEAFLGRLGFGRQQTR